MSCIITYSAKLDTAPAVVGCAATVRYSTLFWDQISHMQTCLTGESVYTVADRSKRRKTADKKAAAAKAAEAAAAVDPSEPWAVHNRQPWADKEVKPAELNDEQKAFLEQVGPCPDAVVW